MKPLLNRMFCTAVLVHSFVQYRLMWLSKCLLSPNPKYKINSMFFQILAFLFVSALDCITFRHNCNLRIKTVEQKAPSFLPSVLLGVHFQGLQGNQLASSSEH